MSYQSPLHLLESLHIQPNELTPAELVRLRKKLLAEFNLSSSVTIAVGERQYTKDEALKAIDRLRDIGHLSEHVVIFQNKPLLNWLENPTEEAFPARAISEQRWSGQSNEFFGQVLAEALQKYCSWLLNKRKFGVAKEPLAVAFALPSDLQDGILTILYDQLHTIVSAINAAIQDPNHAQDADTFGFIVYDDWPDFLNNLPEDLFWDAINNYCISAVNYTVTIQHQQRPFAYEITHQLVRTRCDASLKTTIQSNYAIYRDNYHQKPGSLETSSTNYWRIGWILFIIIKAAIACNG